MTDFATSGVHEDGFRWVSPGGPEHLIEMRDKALKAIAGLPPGEVPTPKQVAHARVYLQIIIDGLELAAGITDLDEEDHA